MPPQPQPLQIGVAGIGRIGRRHALNLLHLIPHARLVCACSPAEADLAWAEHELAPSGGVTTYASFDDMLLHPNLQAVVVASLTTLHYAHTMAALKKGLHVLCEKPVCGSEDEVWFFLFRSLLLPHPFPFRFPC
jgi:myo-inositol 2-dehydrogenase / D-chiro-inositol 1-dehydrogenase